MKNFFARFAKEDSRATAIEYGLIAAILSLAIIGGGKVVSDTLQTMLSPPQTAVTNNQTKD